MGFTLIHPSLALAPEIEISDSKEIRLPEFSSLKELQAIRDRLTAQVTQSDTLYASNSSELPQQSSTTLLPTLQAVEIQIQLEETAKEKWDKAIRFASKALNLQKDLPSQPSESDWQEIYDSWLVAIDALVEIPEQSLLAADVPEKLKIYQSKLATASYQYDTVRSGYLKKIAEQTGLPAENVRITVCHLDGECRRWYGNKPPASPASLIKVPIAIALMDKLQKDNINLETKIEVSRRNYTEDASDVWVGKEYTLRHIMKRMINQSSNIATNQLIEYLGRDHINQLLAKRGYKVTRVNTKLVGERTYPADAGTGPNQMTTDEITEMMRQIFREQHPGDDILIDALASQEDTVLGYDGLRDSKAIWLGEKTGQNSKALGTTVAFMVSDQVYVSTVVLNYSANERALRRCINDIAKRITQQGGL
jgi:beta-lactamase class A